MKGKKKGVYGRIMKEEEEEMVKEDDEKKKWRRRCSIKEMKERFEQCLFFMSWSLFRELFCRMKKTCIRKCVNPFFL